MQTIRVRGRGYIGVYAGRVNWELAPSVRSKVLHAEGLNELIGYKCLCCDKKDLRSVCLNVTRGEVAGLSHMRHKTVTEAF